MVTVLVAAMAYRRAGQALSPDALRKRVAAVEQLLAQHPAPESYLGRIDALEKSAASAASPVQMTKTVNAHTVDLLETRKLLKELQTDFGKMRTRESVSRIHGG